MCIFGNILKFWFSPEPAHLDIRGHSVSLAQSARKFLCFPRETPNNPASTYFYWHDFLCVTRSFWERNLMPIFSNFSEICIFCFPKIKNWRLKRKRALKFSFQPLWSAECWIFNLQSSIVFVCIWRLQFSIFQKTKRILQFKRTEKQIQKSECVTCVFMLKYVFKKKKVFIFLGNQIPQFLTEDWRLELTSKA